MIRSLTSNRRQCREFSAGLDTAIEYIKEVVSKLPSDAESKDAKSWINMKIDQFIEGRIVGAIEVITEKVCFHLLTQF